CHGPTAIAVYRLPAREAAPALGIHRPLDGRVAELIGNRDRPRVAVAVREPKQRPGIMSGGACDHRASSHDLLADRRIRELRKVWMVIGVVADLIAVPDL